LVAALLLSLTLASALFVKIMKSKKDFHTEKAIENNMSLEDLELLKNDRKNKLEYKSEKENLRDKFLRKL